MDTLWYRLEAACHRVDAYLFKLRGMDVEASYSECLALECYRKIAIIELNRDIT